MKFRRGKLSESDAAEITPAINARDLAEDLPISCLALQAYFGQGKVTSNRNCHPSDAAIRVCLKSTPSRDDRSIRRGYFNPRGPRDTLAHVSSDATESRGGKVTQQAMTDERENGSKSNGIGSGPSGGESAATFSVRSALHFHLISIPIPNQCQVEAD